MLTCFDDRIDLTRLDREGFKLTHRPMGHPNLDLANLARVIPSLPTNQVRYSNNLLSVADNFESTFAQRPRDVSINETFERLREGNAYIMVSHLEAAESFRDIYADLRHDVQEMLKARGLKPRLFDSMLYLFIASPNSVTPFHIDRYSTLLLQFRGRKQVSVFPQYDERIVSAKHCEDYVTYENTKLPWQDDLNHLGTCFDFAPGEALHIPFVAGHHVKNGADDISISMSIIFNTEESMRWRRAMAFNHLMRPWLGKMRVTPTPVGTSARRDQLKAAGWKMVAGAKRILNVAN